MTQQHIDNLDKHRHFHQSITGPAQTLKGLNNGEKNDILEAGKHFFGEGYSPDLWCQPCIADMIKQVYNAYDKYLQDATNTI